MYDKYPFELKPLPYAYNALEPYIDEKTMRLHHDKHLQAYVNNLNAALKDYPEYHQWTLSQLLCYSDALPEQIKTDVLNNGGGVYNHILYFEGLSGQKQHAAPELMKALTVRYGNFNGFIRKYKAKALSVFGSGYTWLALDKRCELRIINTPNQDTVLKLNLCPILLIDVWEHAYYLKNFNVRADYIDNWFNVVNWEQAEKLYNRNMQQLSLRN